MQSTGKEKFTVYIYFKTQKWDSANPWSDSESDVDSSDDFEEESSEEEVKPAVKIEINKSKLG